jgi:hypothetical protein
VRFARLGCFDSVTLFGGPELGFSADKVPGQPKLILRVKSECTFFMIASV